MPVILVLIDCPTPFASLDSKPLWELWAILRKGEKPFGVLAHPLTKRIPPCPARSGIWPILLGEIGRNEGEVLVIAIGFIVREPIHTGESLNTVEVLWYRPEIHFRSTKIFLHLLQWKRLQDINA